MKRICDFTVYIRAVPWKLKKTQGRMVLANEARAFSANFLSKMSGLVPKPTVISENSEIELVLNIYEVYGKDFCNSDGNLIPDLDHVATLVQNTLEGIFYRNDRQISSLQIHRRKVATPEDERIWVQLFQIDSI